MALLTKSCRALGVAAAVLLSTAVPNAVALANELAAVTCTTSSNWTYSPGVVLLPRPVRTSVKDQYTSCTSASGAVAQRGSSEFVVDRTAGCLEPLAAVAESRLISWTDGRTSTFSYTVTITSAPGADVITKVGTITDGVFAGRPAQAVQAAPAVDLARCLTDEGIVRQSSLGTFTVL
ncbi:hypothetical protein [Lentzea jiangxiensis]|uniref:Ig-like domain-containing protein n=1 Tax=Lentzea jiangxiensis TaxID=641025 RepID=A0A1H0JVX9_9PSEU|nr:hypothetical protein [Lentzea jiangxiensis]SDO47866.1 hypothetical protein SAMN05421507_102661 [Lentzea jiangxiensis]